MQSNLLFEILLPCTSGQVVADSVDRSRKWMEAGQVRLGLLVLFCSWGAVVIRDTRRCCGMHGLRLVLSGLASVQWTRAKTKQKKQKKVIFVKNRSVSNGRGRAELDLG